jgi:hypothetical protein
MDYVKLPVHIFLNRIFYYQSIMDRIYIFELCKVQEQLLLKTIKKFNLIFEIRIYLFLDFYQLVS